MKYLRNLNNHNAYEAFIIGSDFATIQSEQRAVVSYCRTEEHVHYNPYVPIITKANLLDILYSDANGNLSFTSEVLPVSEGKTPIALCIAGTDFFGINEPARWMSLKYMNYETPDTGSLNAEGMYWGNINNDISTITNIQTTHDGGSSDGYLTSDWITKTDNKVPSLFDANNEWNISVLGTVNQYAVTDIDGKNKTTKILATVSGLPNWQTDASIDNNSGTYYAPAACCCWRYHTLGTQQGDWYLGSCAEISMFVVKRNEINTKLGIINATYPNDCISSINYNRYWTSTEYNNNTVYFIDNSDGSIGKFNKNYSARTIGILSY